MYLYLKIMLNNEHEEGPGYEKETCTLHCFAIFLFCS
jgi:hypothetical protein